MLCACCVQTDTHRFVSNINSLRWHAVNQVPVVLGRVVSPVLLSRPLRTCGQNHKKVREVLSAPWVLLRCARSAVLMVRGD